jgi:DNA-directed RNA polymerase subunit RPC12/RpoP
MDTELGGYLPYISSGQRRPALRRYGRGLTDHSVEGFRCKTCHAHVHELAALSGVQNRNHCPYCLWSRHVDLYDAGDRLSACKAPMEPIGLTIKESRNKYGSIFHGELMLIHHCSECGAVSINRIAADDMLDTLLGIYDLSAKMDRPRRLKLEHQGIHLLEDEAIVKKQLYGSFQN